MKDNGFDIGLIDACRSNDRKAQEKLYRYFFAKLLPMIRRYAINEDDIISIFNDGMLKVFTQLDSFTGKGNFEGWVRKIVLNSLYNYFRKYNIKVKIFELHDYDKSLNGSGTSVLDDMYYEDLLKYLNILPKRSSEIFRMYVLDGYTHKEIAVKLDISEGTSKWHVFKAKEQLAKTIKLNIAGYE